MIYLFVFIAILFTEIKETIQKTSIKNLKEELYSILFYTFVLLFLVNLLASIFSLNFKNQLYLSLIVLVSFVVVFNYHVKYLSNKINFENVSQLLLRLCIYFRVYNKIIPSFRESMKGFDEKFTKECQSILDDYEANGDFKASLSSLSNHYLVYSLAEIFESSEHIGHELSENQLVRLENDIEAWIFQTKQYQEEEKKMRNRMILLMVFGFVISYFAQKMLMNTVDLSSLNTYQHLIFVFLFLNIISFVLMYKRNTMSWFLSREAL